MHPLWSVTGSSVMNATRCARSSASDMTCSVDQRSGYEAANWCSGDSPPPELGYGQ